MLTLDLCWKQRIENFELALAQLNKADELSKRRTLSRLEILGLIHIFEYTCDRASAALRDYLTFQGVADFGDTRLTLIESFKCHLIADCKGWTRMLADRRRSSLVYDRSMADKISERILLWYVPLFRELSAVFNTLLRTSPE